jgi:CheY-like chemotaxis protein
MATAGPRILVAEDNDDLRDLLANTLERAGYQVVALEDGSELTDYFELVNPRTARTNQPDLVLTDMRMPGKTGLEVVQQARQAGITCPVVVFTAFADDGVRKAAAELGDTVVLSKPIEVDALLGVVRQLLKPMPASAPLGARVLVVDDNDELRKLLREALTARGCVVEEAADGMQLTARLVADKKEFPPPDVVITDVRMPWTGGLDVMERFRKLGWKTKFIVMTAFGDAKTHSRARLLGAEEVFDKPFEMDEMVDAALKVVRKRRQN